MNLQAILDIAEWLVEIGLIEFKPGMGLDEIEAEYRERVQGTMQDYMDSDRTIVSFRNVMRRVTNDAYLLAAVAGWVDGGGDGPMPDTLIEYVNQQVDAQHTFIDDVFAKLKELRKSGTQDEQAGYIEGRADGYTASIQGVYDHARVTAAADIMLTFDGPDGSPTSVCSKTGGTCVKLKGQKHPASWWIEQNLIPYKGNPNFDCQCWNCRHSLFDKDGNVWANQQQVSEFDPDQPRDDAGRFSSTGGSGGSGGDEGGGDSGNKATGTVASVKKAVDIIRDSSYGARPDQILAQLERDGIDYVYGYHLTNAEHVEKIKASGIRMSSQDDRKDATYVFLDKSDASAKDIRAHLGYSKKYAIVRVKIPAKDASKMKDDGLFNGTFSSYSAARIFQSVPSDWIDDVEFHEVAEALRELGEFDPDQPRDDAGRFSSTGGSGGSGGDEGGGGSGSEQDRFSGGVETLQSLSDRFGVEGNIVQANLGTSGAPARIGLYGNIEVNQDVIDKWVSSKELEREYLERKIERLQKREDAPAEC